MPSPTIDADGHFRYDDGSDWKPYTEWDAQGVHHRVPDEARMAAELLLNEVLFPNSRKIVWEGWNGGEQSIEPETLVLFVNCNDVFAWACADAESVTMPELPALYELWRADHTWGPTQWCIEKRKQRPQKPVEREMRAVGAWREAYDALGQEPPPAAPSPEKRGGAQRATVLGLGMGEYWKPVNVTRREYIHPHSVDCGLKLVEWTWPTSRVLAIMASWSVGDDIRIVSDYGGDIRVTDAAKAGSEPVTYDDLGDFTEITAPDPDVIRGTAWLVRAAVAPHIRYEDWHAEWAAQDPPAAPIANAPSPPGVKA